MLEDKNVRKSRDQKFTEFYDVLQKEYVIAELRYKIYPDGHRREKSLEIMEAKRKKIIDISIRNRFPSIFESTMLGVTDMYCLGAKNRIYSSIFPEAGYPSFIYRDEEHMNKLSNFDRKCYYQLGSVFITELGEGLLSGYDNKEDKCSINIGGKIILVDSKCVRRKL